MNSANADRAWTTQAPAKVNLDLRMRGVRDDGYHLLSTILQSIDLADRLTLRRADGPFSLTCDTPGVPVDASNLAWRGAAAMAAALDVSLDGWSLRLDKRVPAEAGLGGGSSDAVAAARLVAAASGVDVDHERLAEVVRPLGADVAFFAWGGTVRGEGVGDQLTPLEDAPAASLVLVRPPFGVSTRAAYGWYDTDAGTRRAGVAPSGGLSREGGSGLDWTACLNDLQQPVADRHPEIRAIVGRLLAAGARLAAMSGSGSACFGVFEPATDLGTLLSGWSPGTRVWQTRLLSRADYAALTRPR